MKETEKPPKLTRGGVLEKCRRHFRTSIPALSSQPSDQDLWRGYGDTSCCDAHRNVTLTRAFRQFDGTLREDPPEAKQRRKTKATSYLRRPGCGVYN